MVEYLLVDLISECNLRCIFCPYHSPLVRPPKPSFFPFPQLSELIKMMSQLGIKTIGLSGRGEPTLYPNLFPVVHMAKSLGLEVELFSNASIDIDWRAISQIVDRIYITLTGTGRRYQDFHGRPLWEKVRDNIMCIRDVTENLEINFVLSPFTVRGLLDVVEYFANCGIYVHISVARPISSNEGETFSIQALEKLRAFLFRLCLRDRRVVKMTNIGDLLQILPYMFSPPNKCPNLGKGLVVDPFLRISVCSRQMWAGDFLPAADLKELRCMLIENRLSLIKVPTDVCAFCNEASLAYNEVKVNPTLY